MPSATKKPLPASAETKLTEILSAFYWRENLLRANSTDPFAGQRRTAQQVDALRQRAIVLLESGVLQKYICVRLGISKAYLGNLLEGYKRPRRPRRKPVERDLESVAHLVSPVKALRAEGKSFEQIQSELNISRDKVRRVLRT